MLHTWCCFDSVKDGSLMIGLYTVITRVTAFIIASFCTTHSERVKIILGYPFSHIPIENIRVTFLWITLFSLTFAAAGAYLIRGILKEKHLLIVPWLICTVIDLLGNSVIVILCGIGVVSKTPIGGVIGGMLAVIVLYAFNVHCFLCVISHYENLKHLAIISQFSTHSTRLPSISESLQGLVAAEEQPSPPTFHRGSRLEIDTNIRPNRSIDTDIRPNHSIELREVSSEFYV